MAPKKIVRQWALAGVLISGIAAAQHNADLRVRVNIEPQPVMAALEKFADQTGLQVVFRDDSATMKGLTVPRIVGDLTPHEVLSRLLANTRLKYEFVNAKTVRIMEAPVVGENRSAADEAGALILAQQDKNETSAASSQSSPATGEGASTGADEGQISEIIVTAQKRNERLKDVPISISVLGGRELDSSTDRGVADALNRVPGVINAVANATARLGNTGGAIAVRGVSPTVGASTTAYYLDSIPFGFARQSYTPDPAAYDLERVEVLRGPQGTLYGVSSLNGVVRVLTRDADLNKFEFKGRASTSSTRDGGENYRGDLAVNVPLIEGKLAVRAVAGYEDWSGWISKPFQKDANDAKIGNYRVKINAQPTADLSIGLLAWMSRADFGAPSNASDGLNSLSLYGEPGSTDFDAYGLKIGYSFPAVSLTSMTSYIDFKNRSTFDFAPFTTIPEVLNTQFYSRVFSQEVQLNSAHPGPWRWSVGGIYRDDTDPYQQTATNPITGALTAGFIAPNGTRIFTNSKSYAVFGELTRAFMDGRWELTGGLRYFNDEIEDVEQSRFNFIGGTIDPATGLPSLAPDRNSRFKKTTPRVILAWHPNTEATLYASYSEGFRSGVNQSALVATRAPQFPPADPDDLKNYELGTKGSFWDGRLGFDAAVFYMKWKGVQQGLSVQINPTFLTNAFVNAQSASGAGFEFGLTAEPVTGLKLSTSFSWNDLQVDRDVLTGNPPVVLYPKGSRLAFSPEYTAGASVDYAFPLGGSGYRGNFLVSANYIPERIASRGTAPVAICNLSPACGAEAMLMTRASFGIESARRWMASLFADNIGNEKGISQDQFSTRWNTYLRPRTIGVQLEYRFD